VLAEYNRLTNQELFRILSNADSSVLTREIGSQLTSILFILNHILLSDVTWIRRMSAGAPSLESFSGELDDYEIAGVFTIVCETLADLRDERERIDEMLIRVASTVRDAELQTRFSYRSSRGRQEKLLGHALLHLFNHQTHHRGQISLILDQADVDNDYSNLIWKVE
jgi:uncharacterized damage-inducible protein DinB